MKKILFAIAFVMMMVVGANAQSDNWFKSNDGGYDNRTTGTGSDIALPGGHGYNNDQGAPLGSGLLILTALGAGYAVARRKRD